MTLATAKRGALNITRERYLGLKLKVQFGRCFVLNHRQVLAAATTWEQALENLLQAEVVKFVERHGLVIPPTIDFAPIAELYMSNPDELLRLYNPALPKAMMTTVPSLVNPVLPKMSGQTVLRADPQF